MQTVKKISIVMCTYNGEKYLKDQIDSILQQTYPLHEIIIQDDCSTDATWSILQEYELKNPILKCFQNKKNLGPHLNFLNALTRATGDFIAPSDQDDIWMLNKIEKLLKLIGNNLLIVSQSEILFSDLKRKDSFQTLNPYVNAEMLIWGNVHLGHTLLFSSNIMNNYINGEIKMIVEVASYPENKTEQTLSWDHAISMVGFLCNSYIITEEKLQIWRRHSQVCTTWAIDSTSKTPETKKLSSINKFFLTFKFLLKGQKSMPIKYAFLSRSIFLKNINKKTDCNSKNMILLSVLCKNIAKQTTISYILAGIICVKLRNRLFFGEGSGFIYNLKRISFAFRAPYTYWFDTHKEKFL